MAERICLIVDDDPIIRTYLKTIIQNDNFQALEAENAPQAFRLVQKLNGGLDLIVTDIQMPGDMNGLDLAYAVRNAFPGIPVMLISGYASPKGIAEFEFIQKPFKREAILTTINKLRGSHKRQAAFS